MKTSEYKSYDDLPLFLNAAVVAKALGIAPSSAYELMHEANFCIEFLSPPSGGRGGRGKAPASADGV